jgi:hypothetical protein
MTKPLRQPACHARHERAGIVTRGSEPPEHVQYYIFSWLIIQTRLSKIETLNLGVGMVPVYGNIQ